jgi:hypothetical protein
VLVLVLDRQQRHRIVDVASTLELTIELESGGAAPSGQLRAHAVPPVEFTGWLQLLDALRKAIDAMAEPNGPDAR